MFYLTSALYLYLLLATTSQYNFNCDKATTVDGVLHVRPLCTSGDIVLALYELLDVTIFSSGCIQLPNIFPLHFERHTEGFYRYTYELNQHGKWQYL